MVSTRVFILVGSIIFAENSILSALPVSTWDALNEIDYCPFEPYQAYEVHIPSYINDN